MKKLFYCKKCENYYFNEETKDDMFCEKCGDELLKSSISESDWENYSDGTKNAVLDKMKDMAKSGEKSGSVKKGKERDITNLLNMSLMMKLIGGVIIVLGIMVSLWTIGLVEGIFNIAITVILGSVFLSIGAIFDYLDVMNKKLDKLLEDK